MNDEDKKLAEELDFGGMTPEYQAQEIARFYETLRLRVYMQLEDKLSEQQLIDFDKLSDKGDEKAINEWFQEVFPDYDEIYAAEEKLLKADIKANAEKIRKAIDSAE